MLFVILQDDVIDQRNTWNDLSNFPHEPETRVEPNVLLAFFPPQIPVWELTWGFDSPFLHPRNLKQACCLVLQILTF